MEYPHTFDRFQDLDASDQRELLSLGRDRLLGAIIRLNQVQRYHRRLNVFVILAELLDQEGLPVLPTSPGAPRPGSSAHYPGSSGNSDGKQDDGPIFGHHQR